MYVRKPWYAFRHGNSWAITGNGRTITQEEAEAAASLLNKKESEKVTQKTLFDKGVCYVQ